MTTFKRKQKLPYTFGYELTALPHDYANHPKDETVASKNSDRKNMAVSAMVTAALHKFYPQYEPFKQSVDQHCIEIPSPACHSLKDVFLFYRRAWKVLKQFNYRPQHPATVCGGNHFHFRIQSMALVRNLLRDFYSRPEITWVFTQPDDSDSCSNLCAANYFLAAVRKLLPTTDEIEPDRWVSSWDNYARAICTDVKNVTLNNLGDASGDITKTMGLIVNSKKEKPITLEFRGIESPRNQKEFQDQLDFFISYILWVKKQMRGNNKPQPKVFWDNGLQKITAKEAEANFYALLKQLKLSKKRYQKYVIRNLRQRWTLDRVRD